MMKSILISACYMLISTLILAQEAVTTQGGSFNTDDLNISFTIGEPVIETHSAGDITITQGFNQIFLNSTPITSLGQEQELEQAISIYPNPTANFLKLRLENYEGYQYRIYDLTGKFIQGSDLIDQETAIDLTFLKEGSYQLILIDSQRKKLNGYQIIKL